MTADGRLARGKANYEAGRFLDNPETLEYMAVMPKPKEAKKDAKPNK